MANLVLCRSMVALAALCLVYLATAATRIELSAKVVPLSYDSERQSPYQQLGQLGTQVAEFTCYAIVEDLPPNASVEYQWLVTWQPGDPPPACGSTRL